MFEITEDTVPCAASRFVNSASKGDADIPGVPIARDCAGPDTAAVCGPPIFPALGRDEMLEFTFSDSPGIGDGAKGVEGDGIIKGEFADCKGVPAFVIEDSRFCWSICGEGCWGT